MNLLSRYLKRVDFESYEDFVKNFEFKPVESFNFAYDVVDEYARIAPEKRAIVWCNHEGDEKIITFGELKKLTDKTANMLLGLGLKRRLHNDYA